MAEKIIQYTLHHSGLQPWFLEMRLHKYCAHHTHWFHPKLSSKQESWKLYFCSFCCIPSSLKLPKLKKYKNVAALTSATKKAWDEIISNKVRDICSAAPHWIKDVEQNGRGYIERFCWTFTADLCMNEYFLS